MIACGLGLPFPEDVPLLTGGFLCHRGLAHLYIMVPVALFGVLCGDFILFAIGRRFGPYVTEHRLVRRLVNRRRLLMAEDLFARHGVKIVVAGRFLPGLRPMIFMAAGVLKVSFWRFAAANGLAACVSVPTLVLLGKLFGHSIDQIKRDVRTATHAIALVIIVATLTYIMLYLHRRQRRMMASIDGQVAGEQLSQDTEERPAGSRPHTDYRPTPDTTR